MDFWTRLLLCALAAFRLAEMLVIDDGMFDVFLNLRGWFNKDPLDSKGLRRTISNGLACVHCTGVWIAFLLATSFFFSNPIIDFFIIFLAIAGLQSLIAGKLGRAS